MLWLWILGLVIFSFFIVVIIVCNNVIKRNVIVINSDKIDRDMDIVFVSDIHVGKNNTKKDLRKLVEFINDVDGDYLFIGGDMIGRNVLKYYTDSELKDIFSEFKMKDRYFVVGNHDDFSFSFYDNFKILKDEVVKLSDNIVLLGLEWIKGECLDYKLNRNNFNILLSHYPDRVKEYSKVDLALGGHSHGRQINFPFCRFHHKEEYTRGLYRLKNNKKLYVNKGLGFSLLKLRVFSCREIVKIKLRKGGNENGN